MDIEDKVVIVTGAASGIGRALAQRFAEEGARAVVVADRDERGTRRVAEACGGHAFTADVACEEDVQKLVADSEARFGGVDLFCSNAGIMVEGDETVPDAEWQRIWQVNVMAHVYAARAVLPGMLERGRGYLLNTASAAGLLTQIGSAPYAVTKHSAVAFAEWLSVTYGDRGIGVSCLCPQGVRTGMLNEASGPRFLLESALSPEDVATAVVEGLRDERFLILPHPEVAEYARRRAEDHDRWIRGMRRLSRRFGN
jgi:NAD(P)-dependent dehydrogenase (short-subunit alcohol dehydrogenase family)